MTYLLDVSVLIALMDPASSHHAVTQNWFGAVGSKSWATCPITQNGLIRIVGNPRYPNSPGSPRSIAELLAVFTRDPGHEFWNDDVSLTDTGKFDLTRLLTQGQVTDTYLLGLAISHGGMFATLDHRLLTDAVINGTSGLHLVR